MKLRILSQKYPCGDCTVCCTVVAQSELGKPSYSTCQHVVEKGCQIHPDRPRGCREFMCTWAAGLIADAVTWRPDNTGLMCNLQRQPSGDLWLEIYEAVPGAADDKRRVDYLIQRIASRVERIEKIVKTTTISFKTPQPAAV